MYVSTRTAGDIAITAAEGGIGYWSQIDEYRPKRWIDWDTGDTRRVARDFTFYNIRVLNDTEDGYDEHPYAVDTDLIQRGVNLFLVHSQFYDMSDLSVMDSDEADAVIQLGLFGKVMYG